MITRLRSLLAIVVTFLMLFAGRLMYLQVVAAESLRVQSEQNVRIEKRILPLRGRILARDGTVLADNRVASDLMYWGGEIENWERLKYLLKIEDKPVAPDFSDPEQSQVGSVAVYNVPDDLVPAVEELVAGQASLYLRERIERTYPTNLAAQVIGYTAEAKGRFESYGLEDLVGIMGLEASLQDELFGVPGKMSVQVDNKGVVLDVEVRQAAKPGKDVVLTLDPRVQNMAEDVLEGALTYVNEQRQARDLPLEDSVKGAIIAMNPKTGGILAMASAPSFDQNVFTKRPSDPEAVAALLNDTKSLPLANRAVEAYPPASTFKLVSSSALLESGFVGPGTQFFCSASLSYGGIRWDNWSYPSARGTYDVTGAIADSCNTYYWRAAISTPNFSKGWADFAKALSQRAFDFGYGEIVDIGLSEEKPGRIPTDEWSRSFHGWAWRPGDTLNVSIGQGDTLATPLQTAQLVATMALDGMRVKPHLVSQIGQERLEVGNKQVSGQFWSTLKVGMRKMITDYGTRRFLGPAVFPVQVAGKTGTAQNAKGTGYDHVWFASFAPLDDPEIVMVVFIEHGDKSTGVAVPAGRDFLKAYFGIEDE